MAVKTKVLLRQTEPTWGAENQLLLNPCSTGDQPKILYKPAKPSISELHLQPTRQTCWQHWDPASQATLSQFWWKTTSNLGFCYHPTIRQAWDNIPGPRRMFLPCSLLQEAIKCSLLILVEHVKKEDQRHQERVNLRLAQVERGGPGIQS